MRKQCKRKVHRLVAPTIVAMHINPEISIQERIAVLSVSNGWANTSHFNVLADCRDMLMLAASHKGDEETLAVCHLSGIALMNMKDRYAEKGKIGATGDEIQALHALVDVSEDFWKRQGGGLFIDAEASLSRAREMCAKEAQMRRDA